MTLTNYWWLLIWIFIGGVLALFIPKQQELVNGRKVERWTMPAALILIAPYDVLIAPNSYVNVDIPSHSVVIGNPATIHHCDNATGSYVNYCV